MLFQYLWLGERLFYLSLSTFYGKVNEWAKAFYKPRIDQTINPVPREDAEALDPDHLKNIKSGYWYRIAHFAMTYPWPVMVVIFGLFSGLLFVVITKARFGNGGVSLLPLNSEIRAATDDITNAIPSTGKSSLTVYMKTKGSIVDFNFLSALDAYTTEVEQVENVIQVINLVRMKSNYSVQDYYNSYSNGSSSLSLSVKAPFYISDLSSISITTISLSVEKDDAAIPQMINTIREYDSDSVVTPYLADYGLTGDPALDYDLLNNVTATFPNLIAVLIVAMFVLIFLVSGSLFIPVKTLITTFVSLIISYAFLILIFQEGPADAESLLQFKHVGTLDPLILLFIFATSFGLSLDYEGKLPVWKLVFNCS